MNSNILKIYNASPIWGQNILMSLYGLKLYLQRYNSTYKQAFKKFSQKKYFSLKQEQDNQFNQLIQLINHANIHSVFYKKQYKEIDLSDIKSIDDLNKLPIIDKETFRANINQIYTITEKEGYSSFTGGTTGKALKVIFTKSDFQKRMAYLDAFKFRLGIHPFKSRKATFSGREFTDNPQSKAKKEFWRNNYIYNQRLYSTFDLTEENLPYYVENLNKFKPNVLNGFVSALFEVASYIERTSTVLSFKPKAIFTTSETLLPFHREKLEKVFNTKVYNQYASAEGAPFITECLKGNLHYNIDTGVIELTNNAEMLITSFTTYGTPLIRYKIGDAIQFKDGECTCGSSHPLVEKIEGRMVEYLLSKDRGKVSLSHLADVIKGMPNSIINMQFVQNDLNTIHVYLVIDERLFIKGDEQSILKEMSFRFGENTAIKIHYVDNIPREKSGKYTLIKNNINKK